MLVLHEPGKRAFCAPARLVRGVAAAKVLISFLGLVVSIGLQVRAVDLEGRQAVQGGGAHAGHEVHVACHNQEVTIHFRQNIDTLEHLW